MTVERADLVDQGLQLAASYAVVAPHPDVRGPWFRVVCQV